MYLYFLDVHLRFRVVIHVLDITQLLFDRLHYLCYTIQLSTLNGFEVELKLLEVEERGRQRIRESSRRGLNDLQLEQGELIEFDLILLVQWLLVREELLLELLLHRIHLI